VAGSYQITHGVLLEVQNRRGLEFPEEVGIIGFDYPYGDCLRSPLTVISRPAKEMGRRAAELVIGGIEGGQRNKAVIFPAELEIRGSCHLNSKFPPKFPLS